MLADLFSLNDSAVAQPLRCGGMLLRALELSPTLCSQQKHRHAADSCCGTSAASRAADALIKHIIMMPVCANHKLSDWDHLKEVCL